MTEAGGLEMLDGCPRVGCGTRRRSNGGGDLDTSATRRTRGVTAEGSSRRSWCSSIPGSGWAIGRWAEVDALSRWDTNGNGRITCEEARQHGIAPVGREHPAYQFMRDGDGDGVVCE